MKNKLTLLFLALTSLYYAQPAFKLFNKTTSVEINPNTVIQMITIEEDVVKYTVDIQNKSGSTKKYIVKRYDILLHASTAVANLCFASACYSSNITQSPDSLVLLNDQKASELDAVIPNNSLDADLTEYGPIGKSIVKYTILNAMNHADSAQIVFSYNGAITGVKELSNKNVSSLNLFPNPAKDNTTLTINSTKASQVQVGVYNLLGDVIYTENVNLAPGDNTIKLDVKTYPKGIYFVNVPNGNSAITKKFVVN